MDTGEAARSRPHRPAPPTRGSRASSTAPVLLLPLLGLAIGIAAWWGAIIVFDISATLLPAPPEVLSELARLYDYLLEQGRVTLLETTVGFAITAVGGLLIGTTIAGSRIIDHMATPWLVAFNAVPKVAFAPLLVVWLGYNLQPRVVMVALICFFPIVLSTATGLRSTPAELVDLGRSLRASRRQAFMKLRLPYALPQIFVGLKVAMPLAAIGAVIGEFAGGQTGLGYVIRQASANGNTALAFAAIVVLSVMSIALFYLLVIAERLLVPWVRATTA